MTTGPNPDVVVEGPAVASTMTGSAFEECRFRVATCLLTGSGSGPSYLSSPPLAVGAYAGGSTICSHDDLHMGSSCKPDLHGRQLPFREKRKPPSSGD
jgi:hypothetical protein